MRGIGEVESMPAGGGSQRCESAMQGGGHHGRATEGYSHIFYVKRVVSTGAAGGDLRIWRAAAIVGIQVSGMEGQNEGEEQCWLRLLIYIYRSLSLFLFFIFFSLT